MSENYKEVHPFQKKRKLKNSESTIDLQFQSVNTSFHDTCTLDFHNPIEKHATELLPPTEPGEIHHFHFKHDLTTIRVSIIDQYIRLLLKSADFWNLSYSELTLFPDYKCSLLICSL